MLVIYSLAVKHRFLGNPNHKWRLSSLGKSSMDGASLVGMMTPLDKPGVETANQVESHTPNM